MKRLDELEVEHPWIAWRVPISVKWPEAKRYACRVCIANHGLKLDSIQWENEADAQLHINTHHGQFPK
jgi:hypothetical protein